MSRRSPVEVEAVPSPPVSGLAAKVMVELHHALRELLSLGGEPIARAVDVERVFRLDKTLSWRIFRIAQSPDLSEAGNVPSRPAVRRLLDAAARRRIPKPVIERVGRAFEEFEQLAAVHGGDRDGLISMVSGLMGDKSEQYETKVRKSLFKGNAHVWGVHARMATRTAVYMPRRFVGRWRLEDITFIAGDIGLAHRHLNTPLVTHHWLWTHDESAETARAENGEALGAVVDHGLQVLPLFSTQPLPKMSGDGTMYGAPQTALSFPPGLANAVTLYSMHKRENYPTPAAESFYFQSIFRLPIETLVWEILVPVGWSDPATARAAIYGCRDKPDQVYEEQPSDMMSPRQTLDYLGVHEGVPPLSGAPSHADAVESAIERAGWRGNRFDVYRCTVEYPVLFTMFAARVDVAKR